MSLHPARHHLGIVVALLFLVVPAARAEFLVGLTTSNSLVTFDSTTPGTVSSAVAITGIGVGETIYDIDFRPANGLLYGFGSGGNLYAINRTTGVAILSASLSGVTLDSGTTRVGIDYNPTVDRVRIVSNTGQDLRLTPGTSLTTVDGTLTSGGVTTGVTSVAYTNNFSGATSTTLYYIGSGFNPTLYSSTNPNAGVLTTVGLLGPSSTENVGFDISGTTGIAYASFSDPGQSGSSLYTVNLATGAATRINAIGNGLQLRGFAIAPSAVPEPASVILAGMGLIGLAGLTWRQRRRAA